MEVARPSGATEVVEEPLDRGALDVLAREGAGGQEMVADELVEPLARPKKGFSVPLTYWFREGLDEFIGDHLLAPGALSGEYVQRAAVERLFGHFRRTGRAGYLHQLWSLLVLELWRRDLSAEAPA